MHGEEKKRSFLGDYFLILGTTLYPEVLHCLQAVDYNLMNTWKKEVDKNYSSYADRPVSSLASSLHDLLPALLSVCLDKCYFALILGSNQAASPVPL